MSGLPAIRAIARRELGQYFGSPVAYVFLVIFLLLAGIFTFTFGAFFDRGEASLASFFTWIPWLFLFLVPAIGMRMWAEERRAGTWELLLTMPVTAGQAILGKFFASWLFLALALALTFPVWLTVNWLGEPDNGVIVAAYVGCWLLGGAYLAVTCMTSSFTRNQVVAFIIAVILCLLFILIGFTPITDMLARYAAPDLVDAVAAFGVMTHFDSFAKGVLDLRGIVYFAALIALALFITAAVIRNRRS